MSNSKTQPHENRARALGDLWFAIDQAGWWVFFQVGHDRRGFAVQRLYIEPSESGRTSSKTASSADVARHVTTAPTVGRPNCSYDSRMPVGVSTRVLRKLPLQTALRVVLEHVEYRDDAEYRDTYVYCERPVMKRTLGYPRTKKGRGRPATLTTAFYAKVKRRERELKKNPSTSGAFVKILAEEFGYKRSAMQAVLYRMKPKPPAAHV